MKKQILKYLSVAAIAVMMLLPGCEEVVPVIPLKPCELEGIGTFKLINKAAMRFKVKIDGVDYGQIKSGGDVKMYDLPEGEYYVCIELSNVICYKEFTIIVTPCTTITKEINY